MSYIDYCHTKLNDLIKPEICSKPHTQFDVKMYFVKNNNNITFAKTNTKHSELSFATNIFMEFKTINGELFISWKIKIQKY